uniref:VTT domain-containing protein n=1 Tax=Pyramimonas obovata TaxID=1411642 RepID=A0A7S0RLH6_9CHLO|mmetsp:Transcript_37457/g.81545  ORF Transcript_37457/g.81545 Transcript_37457/m.81545 type:complete len:298 (+) Transcript_37457:58-951(+)
MVTTRRGTEVKSPAPPKKVEGKTRVTSAAQKPTQPKEAEFTWSLILFMIGTFVVFVTYLGVLFYTLPKLEDDVRAGVIKALKPPHKLEDAIVLRDAISEYAADHAFHTALVLASVYVFAQTFAIPGTLTLSLLSGALFGFYKGIALVVGINLIGSSFCFFINTKVGRSIAYRVWPSKVRAFQREVEKRRSSMTNYIFFLRVTPFLPNTFINVASPVVNVPYPAFVIGTVTGTFPNNFMAVKAGMKLSEITSISEMYDPWTLGFFVAIGFLVLLPALLAPAPNFAEEEEEEPDAKKAE